MLIRGALKRAPIDGRRWIGCATLFAALLLSVPALGSQITVSAAERHVEIERGYSMQFWTPLYGGLQLFAASYPAYAHLWPTPSTIEDASTATSGNAVVSRVSTQIVDALSSQTSTITAHSIEANGDVNCAPGILFEDGPSQSVLIFSRCRASTLLDVAFSLDAEASYSLRAFYSLTYTEGTSSARLRLLDGQGAVLKQLTPTGCGLDPAWPPGWAENGFIEYDVALEVTGVAVQAPVTGATGTLLMVLAIAGSALRRAASPKPRFR